MIRNTVEHQHILNYINDQDKVIKEYVDDKYNNIEFPKMIDDGYYNVLEHKDIVADGITDCTAGIQEIFDKINQGIIKNVLFPPGTYKITQPLTLNNGQRKTHILGYGAIIKAFSNQNGINEFLDSEFEYDKTLPSSNDAIGMNQLNEKYKYMIYIGIDNSYNEFLTVEGLSIDGNNQASGIQLHRAHGFLFSKVHVNNCFKGIEIMACYYGEINNMTRIYNCRYGLILSGKEVNTISLDNISIKSGVNTYSEYKEVASKNSIGMVLACANLYNVKFNGLTIESNHYGIKAIKRYSDSTYAGEGIMEFNNCYFEHNSIASIDFDVQSQDSGIQYINKNQTFWLRSKWKINIRNCRCHTSSDKKIILGIGIIHFENCQEDLDINIAKEKFGGYRTQIISDQSLSEKLVKQLDGSNTANVNKIGLNRNKFYSGDVTGDSSSPKSDIQTLIGAIENIYVSSSTPLKNNNQEQLIKKNHLITQITPYSQIYCTQHPLLKPVLPIVYDTNTTDFSKTIPYGIEVCNGEIKPRKLGTKYLNQRGYSGQELYNMLKIGVENFTLSTKDNKTGYYCNELEKEIYLVQKNEDTPEYYFIEGEAWELNSNLDFKNGAVLGDTSLLLNYFKDQYQGKSIKYYDVITNQIIEKRTDGTYYICSDIFGNDEEIKKFDNDIAYYLGSSANPWDVISTELEDEIKANNIPRLFFFYTDKDGNIKYSLIQFDFQSRGEYTQIDLSDYITNNFRK